ncbi:MAG: stage IV sporulation protein A [Christensenellaceae bacterium]|jgi:stage IV sporulation protein A|nr:stage IV sporulation protein A [Christensenellaceae bacterium]
MDRIELYRDIAERTDGDIYMGVVGPVRTGKSTFIKRFMDILVLPGIQDEFARARLVDELPQSAAGNTIMTTQPKFIPNEAARIMLGEDADVRIRMVDCVGYMVNGAKGHMENDVPRMVRTPWYDYDIPFEDAAEIGTRKVITDHSTIGVVVTTDGSIAQIDRAAYVPAEQRVITELKEHGKPFVIVLNSTHPELEETVRLAESLAAQHNTAVLPMDVMNMSAQSATDILERVLYEFPMRMLQLRVPGWVRALGLEHWLVQRAMSPLGNALGSISKMRDYQSVLQSLQDVEGFEEASLRRVELGAGHVEIELKPQNGMFYTVIGEECGYEIKDDAHLISTIKEFVTAKREYDRLQYALDRAYTTGYGMVPPEMDAMQLDQPQIVQHGSRFGVKLRARASGLHLIKVDIESEVSPLVGTQEQSAEFMHYLTDTFENNPEEIWHTNIFGKPLYDLVREGMANKVNRLPEEVQQKLQETVQRMVNDGCNGLICIML